MIGIPFQSGIEVGVSVGGGVEVEVGGTGVSVAVGGSGVFVDVGVIVGPNICPGAQLDVAKLKSKTNIITVRCLVFILLLRYRERTRRLLKMSRILMQHCRTIFWFHTCATVN
jgi:hypothetical protein